MMRFASTLSLITLTLGALALVACGEEGGETNAGRGSEGAIEDLVMTTFYPMTYIAQRIAGDAVRVECPLPSGEDPKFWRPSPEVMERYQRARVVLLNGAEFEKWAMTAPLARSRVVRTADAISGGFITIEGETHSHGPDGEHTHAGTDGHTWVDPVNAADQAARVRDALALAFPESAEAFAQRTRELRSDLLALHERLTELTPAIRGVRLLASHPAYNYPARRHGWEIVSLDLVPDLEPTPEQWAEVRALAEDPPRGGVLLMWESEPMASTVERLEGIGVRSVVFTPAENPDAEVLEAGEDYLSLMRANVDRLAEALSE